MFRARLAYRTAFRDSAMFESAGDTQHTISVCELPPRESCSIRVSFESRYGTWTLPRFSSSPRALITLPSASKPLLMSIPSFNRTPEAPVRLARSDPARSTKWNLLRTISTSFCTGGWLSSSLPPSVCCDECETSSTRGGDEVCFSNRTVKIACERLEVPFISVAAVVLHRLPFSSSISISSAVVTTCRRRYRRVVG